MVGYLTLVRVIYSTGSGKEPYVTWENKLDLKARAIIISDCSVGRRI
ncbi:hypothetical protein KAT92_02255 [Candidatus Babeliales bacterium]|nr:hypothetical protein [Candidatus Babeliales bacterium]